MEKRVTFGTKEWADYLEFRLREGLQVEEGFTLAMLEIEVPFTKLGFETFESFLQCHIPNLKSFLKNPNSFKAQRSVIPMDAIGNVEIGSRVIWFGSDSTTFKGTVKWLGNIERILCAGVLSDVKVGSPFPIIWKGERLFLAPTGQALLLRVNELILKTDYDQNQKSKISRTMSKLMRKVTIRERPREPNSPDSQTQSRSFKYDIIYPYAVDSETNGLKLNDSVFWTYNGKSHWGIVKWIGHLNCRDGLIVGVDFKTNIGNSNGTYENHKLFDCSPNQGRFLCVKCIQQPNLSTTTTALNQNDFMNQDLRQYWLKNQHLSKRFKIGDTVLYQRDPNYFLTGTIVWLGIQNGVEMAGIQLEIPVRNPTSKMASPLPFECTAGHGELAHPEKLVLYNRNRNISNVGSKVQLSISHRDPSTSSTSSADESMTEIDSPLPGFQKQYVIERCITPERLKYLIGYRKGIEGQKNSSHWDSVLFALFSCTEILDSHLLKISMDDTPYSKVLKALLTEVANQLRKEFFCSSNYKELVQRFLYHRMKFNYPKTSDGILEALFSNTSQGNSIDGFVRFRNGETKILHRIMASSFNFSQNIVTIQDLLETDMKLLNLKFQTLPSPALVLVLPEHNYELASTKLVIPNTLLELEIETNEVDCYNLTPYPCILCGTTLVETITCPDCANLLVSPSVPNSSSNIFCHDCFDAFHQHWTRRNHNRKSSSNSVNQRRKLFELHSIICIRENQSIVFVKCGVGKTAEWIVHDSTSGGSESQVQSVFSLADCLVALENEPTSVLKDWSSFIPEVKIILSFAHICIYSLQFSQKSIEIES